MNLAIAITLLLLCALLTLASYVERLYAEIGKFLSREFQQNIDTFEQRVEPKLAVSRSRAALSMALLRQLLMAAIAMVVGFGVFRQGPWTVDEVLEAVLGLVLVVIIFDRFLPFVFFSRTKGEWLVRWTPVLRALIYLILPLTLILGFLQSVTALTREHSGPQPETQAEAVDALIEAGQEEGILDESNRELIQSVVEFSDKTAREAMKPRPEMVAVSSGTTVEQFVELLRLRSFSRVPVFEGTIDNIVGIVYAKDVLQVPDAEAHNRSVGSLMRKEVYFVPETKLASDLLREMQKNKVRMAIVIDEYGGVAGLVTIEDLVEEIVGEIADEHETAQVVRENESSYLVPGNMDVDRLEELLGIRPDRRGAATVAGLVSELAGRIPQKGEIIEEDGLRLEVLQASDRRVERVRVSVTHPQQMKLI
ncbi:MAG: HlyC/CorC family transporter [Acidobacteria bacterium]|nr:HlyC/CorC family transporter [Acidobacteriota bacterium]MBV9623495.1 HlyC/CorC family transporter [Acidobacteriota bacterium]